MKRTWTPEQLELLKDKYPESTQAELLSFFPDKTKAAIKTKATVLGLKKKNAKFRFTPEQLCELKRDFATTLNKDLANRFGCSIHTIESIGFKHKLKKDAEFLRNIFREKMQDPDHPGRKFLIKKGNIPMNKGKKQTGYMSPEAIERTKATRFRKGSIPPNAVPVGYERIDKDGYVYIKVEGKRKLVLKHRYIWEQHNGPIPKGYNIQFKDGNKHNCDINNLYMISRVEQMATENSASLNLPDNAVAVYLAGKRKQDKEFVEQLKQHPELLNLKRTQILLNRKIKEQNGSNQQT